MASTSAVLAALALAAWAPAAGAQELPLEPPTAEIPQPSAISDQYQAVEEAVQEALPPAPEPPAEPAPAPEPVPAPDQYHSETPPSVSVTQDQPANVNVSIRINSPGDDGPVVQINNAGGTTDVEQKVEQASQPAPPAAEAPTAAAPAPQPAALPDTWEWVWTSACFGGGAGAAAAAPGWTWRWSCDAEAGGGGPATPDAWPLGDVLPSPSDFAGVPGIAEALGVPTPVSPSASEPARKRRPAARRPDGAAGGGGGGPGAGPPPVVLGRSLVAASADAAVAASAPVREVVRTVARARPPDSSNLLFPPGEGPAAGASNALGAVASLLLGVWIAVLTAAVALALPRIRRRRWSGPAWRLTRGPSARLERPG